jgi:pyruvate kinase
VVYARELIVDVRIAMNKRCIPRTKIVCTLGPASSSETVLRKLVQSGMDFARINFSHGTPAKHRARIELVRTINRKYRRHVRLIGDLEGPRIRIGHFKGGKSIQLEKNRTVCLVQEGTSQRNGIPFDYPGDLKDIEGAEFLYLDDGNIILKVKRVVNNRIDAKVVVGGELKQRKALNIPGAKLKFPSVTEKDNKDIAFAVEQGLDYVAQSFVRTPKDVLSVRAKLKESGGQRIRIISKIECREGIRNIDGIIEASDGIMVARGDMGVSIPVYEVPLVQKQIIRKCNMRKKLVITATQMLESMVHSPTPTRAEVTDVANAVIDGTDCVMLSAETAVGAYPVETVRMMNQIIRHTEQNS